MKTSEIYKKYSNWLSRLKDLPLLLIRLTLAYGFYIPAKLKWNNINGIGEWFDSLNYPMPLISAYLAATTETLGILLLFLGLGTRIISIPLIFIMLVVIFTIHIGNGFDAGSNGFEIPLYYALMLLVLLIFGPGKFSIDFLIGRKKN